MASKCSALLLHGVYESQASLTFMGLSDPGSWFVSVSEASLSFRMGGNKKGPETHGAFLWACLGLTLFEECWGPNLTCPRTPGLLCGVPGLSHGSLLMEVLPLGNTKKQTKMLS